MDKAFGVKETVQFRGTASLTVPQLCSLLYYTSRKRLLLLDLILDFSS